MDIQNVYKIVEKGVKKVHSALTPRRFLLVAWISLGETRSANICVHKHLENISFVSYRCINIYFFQIGRNVWVVTRSEENLTRQRDRFFSCLWSCDNLEKFHCPVDSDSSVSRRRYDFRSTSRVGDPDNREALIEPTTTTPTAATATTKSATNTNNNNNNNSRSTSTNNNETHNTTRQRSAKRPATWTLHFGSWLCPVR